ncbi:MAG: lytic murein transglycosylase B [Rubrivivax sp.]|nr:lytic murein transglycosylase B [Rubrivivax sp.]
MPLPPARPARRRLMLSALFGVAAPALMPLPAAAAPRGEGPRYAGRAEVAAFAAEVASRRGLPRRWLQQQLAQARRIEPARRLIMPPPASAPPDWERHRAQFLRPDRIKAGADFWVAHRRWLGAAESRFGVPAEIVVGIVGVETFYGRITGQHRVIDALATLAFDFPAGRSDRSAFFRAELEEFLVWCAREGADPQAQRGSFAGAMGLPQFMPGSINRWAVDFDEDGHINLLASAADAVGSVANYLAGHGWQRDLPTHHAVELPAANEQWQALLAPDITPRWAPAQFAERAATLPAAAHAQGAPLALVELRNPGRASHFVAGTANFQVITRYNFSRFYAMAVIELGQAVRAEIEARPGEISAAPPGR